VTDQHDRALDPRYCLDDSGGVVRDPGTFVAARQVHGDAPVAHEVQGADDPLPAPGTVVAAMRDGERQWLGSAAPPLSPLGTSDGAAVAESLGTPGRG